MSLVVHKYVLSVVSGPQAIWMPRGSELLHFDVQRGELCLWSLVDTDVEKVIREFEIYSTGREFHSGSMEFVGTVLMGGGSLVWHLFERSRP